MKKTIHLTESGFHAGRRLCMTDRSDGQQNVHAAYAPLHLKDFRRDCCHTCLSIWANEAYDSTDDMPDYIAAIRNITS